MRRIVSAFAAVVVALALSASAAFAGSPHQVQSTTISISGNTLTASGKEAGLGGESQVQIQLTADALCINGGSNHPKAVNKASVSAAGTFPVQNGKADFTLSATAHFQPDCSPPMTVQFQNISVLDVTNGIQLYP